MANSMHYVCKNIFSVPKNFHKNSLINKETFGLLIEHSLYNQLKIDHRLNNRLNKLMTKNRNILKLLIGLACFLGIRRFLG